MHEYHFMSEVFLHLKSLKTLFCIVFVLFVCQCNSRLLHVTDIGIQYVNADYCLFCFDLKSGAGG